MNKIVSKLRIAIKYLKIEEGQDLVEYALVVALIALVVITGMKGVATALNTVFTNIATQIT